MKDTNETIAKLSDLVDNLGDFSICVKKINNIGTQIDKLRPKPPENREQNELKKAMIFFPFLGKYSKISKDGYNFYTNIFFYLLSIAMGIFFFVAPIGIVANLPESIEITGGGIAMICTLAFFVYYFSVPGLILYLIRKAMIRKYNQAISLYIKNDVNEYKNALKKYDALVLELNQECDEVYKQCSNAYNQCVDNTILPAPYNDPLEYENYACAGMPFAPIAILDYFKTQRVDTVKEAINLYISENREMERDSTQRRHNQAVYAEQQAARRAAEKAAESAERARIEAEEHAKRLEKIEKERVENSKKQAEETRKVAEEAKKIAENK